MKKFTFGVEFEVKGATIVDVRAKSMSDARAKLDEEIGSHLGMALKHGCHSNMKWKTTPMRPSRGGIPGLLEPIKEPKP